MNEHTTTKATTSPEKIAAPACALATRMRELLGWVASNVEQMAEDDVSTYETNALRSQLLQLLALANDVEALEMSAHIGAAKAVQS